MNREEFPIPEEPILHEENPQENAAPETPPEQSAGGAAFEQTPSPEPVRKDGFVYAAPVKELRVGRVTLGVTLILAGILLLLGLFMPDFSIFAAAKFAPVVLILYGAEILISSLIARGRRIRYDFSSVLICFLLVVGSFALSFVPMLYQNTVIKERLEWQVSQEIEDEVYHAAASEGIRSVSASLYLEPGLDREYRADMESDEVKNMARHASLDITLDQQFPDAAAFALKVRQVLDSLKGLGLEKMRVNICEKYDESRGEQGSLYIDSRYQWDFPAEKLEALCSGFSGAEESATE